MSGLSGKSSFAGNENLGREKTAYHSGNAILFSLICQVWSIEGCTSKEMPSPSALYTWWALRKEVPYVAKSFEPRLGPYDGAHRSPLYYP